MKVYLEETSFKGLYFEYHEFDGETHNSEVPLALKLILLKLKLN
jgi:hypothetical protein